MQTTLANGKRLYTFKPRDLIPLPRDVVWLLQQGAVKTLTWNEEGTLITLGYWGAGDVVGQPFSQIAPYQIQCLTRVKAVCISLHQWNWSSDAVRRYIQQTEELLYIIRSDRIPQRLFKILIWLAQKFGRKVQQGQLIELPLTHQELAEVAGTTRVTVTKLLNQFERKGTIYRPYRRAIVVRSSNPYYQAEFDRNKIEAIP
ncbi:MAG: Crp/Fnr family transcriptional regulator [Hydrococcus sp. C42_A2020_068]|uniref:Crp/Fnr family transcriptional regulator n=1 Tax=Pleurocapsa sp. PCC 7327 TaxID=118163 RepID=UPI00029F9698|nr:Crp/Fnr family transcriptional regulator [Pleurocapsa sp. PCC 7327]AFY75588.1 cAMP-binding protein [Pleurocapsa sp. PCC 7327]MBF2022080.1 Crp/Fnr family transcriptional regulator [Hydrococcus sp. C42_A2020_068]